MTHQANDLLVKALDLPNRERAEIASRLIESLDESPATESEDLWLAEIDRRCAAIDRGEEQTTDWEVVRARIQAEMFGR
jgi:putative addiction module component (TIGR02574 family)